MICDRRRRKRQATGTEASMNNLRDLAAKIGGAERNRTADLLIANEALSQLSYSPNAERTIQPSRGCDI